MKVCFETNLLGPTLRETVDDVLPSMCIQEADWL